MSIAALWAIALVAAVPDLSSISIWEGLMISLPREVLFIIMKRWVRLWTLEIQIMTEEEMSKMLKQVQHDGWIQHDGLFSPLKGRKQKEKQIMEKVKMPNINFKKLNKYLFAGLFAFVISSILCAADSYAVFDNLTKTGWEIFGGMRKIIFAAAGFGVIAVAIGAIFGALNWKWLSAIIIGIVVIATTASIVNYLTKGTGADVTVSGISDTLKTGQ